MNLLICYRPALLLALLLHAPLPLALPQEPDPTPEPDPVMPVLPELPVASIIVTDSRGLPVTEQAPLGEMLIVSAERAVHARVEGSLTWIVEPPLQTFTVKAGDTLVVNTGLKPCVLRIMQIVSTTSGKNAYQRISIKIGGGPNPPPDPGPGPNPDPGPGPDPDPDPDPNPTPQPGSLKVLIVEETSQRSSLSSDQQTILFARDIRQYCQRVCSKGPDGKTPDLRIFDQNVDVSKEAQWLQTAMKEQRDSLPWIVLSNGQTGYSGPLPANTAETLELLKRYGGP